MTALVLIGQMRTWNHSRTIKSYETYLSKHGRIDLYIFTWNKLGYSNRHGDHNLNGCSEDVVTERQIREYYQPYTFINVRHVQIDNYGDFIANLDQPLSAVYHTPFRNHSPYSTCVPIQYKYQQAARHLEQTEGVQDYSNMVVTRPDMCFVDGPVAAAQDGTLYYNCPCVRCFDHCWCGKPRTVIKHLVSTFDHFLPNYHALPKRNHLNRDNNELLHLECAKNKIRLCVDNKQMVEVVYF